MIDINTNPTRRQLRVFAAIWFPAAMAVIGWFVWRTSGSWGASITVWIAAIVVGAAGFCIPRLMRLIYVGWMLAAWPIGWAVSHLLLTLLFYAILTPIGLVMRLWGYDPLQRTFDRSVDSYWTPRENPKDPSRYLRQF